MPEKMLPTDLNPANVERVLGLLAEVPGRLEVSTRGCSPDDLRRSPAPGERSILEIAAHMLHVEARAFEAITAALVLEEPPLLKIHPERAFGKLARYDRHPFADLLAYYRLRRGFLMGFLTGLTDVQWGRTVREEGKARRESVYWLARGLALHEHEHLAEIAGRGKNISANIA